MPLAVPSGTHRLSDRLLVARVAAGDDQAFGEIFDRYGPALLGFCAHMLGSREWGEDALQLTFVAAYKALRRGGCDGALRPWLYAIARNRCVSELRGCREIPDSDRVSADRSATDGPASVFARREQLREIVEDIQRLPADQRAALVLFELGDQSHEEIAVLLGVRREKVKALIFQAREGLYRGRSARESACSEVRERLANARGKTPARGVVRAHIDRCAPCQEFEREVRTQRTALALVLPVALSGNLKALVLSSALGHGSAGAGAASVTGAGGAGSLASAATAGSGSGAVAGAGSLGAGAAASATGSASTALGGSAVAAAGSGAVSVAAGAAAPTMVASALGTDAVVGVGALTSSLSVAAVAKLATVAAVAVGVGGVMRSALNSSPRPQVSFLAAQPARPAPLRTPLQPLALGIVNPLAGATTPGSLPTAGAGTAAPAGAPPTGAANAAGPSSGAAPSSVANPAGPTARGADSPTSPTGSTSAPAASTPSDGSATTTAPSSSTSTPTESTPTASTPTASTLTASTPTASTPTASTPTASTPTTTASSPTGSGDSTGQDQSSGGAPGSGVTHANGNGRPITPPGCVNNPAQGCAQKAPHS
jgi:RNA polymerase sigma factor (sigma-70 family)